MRHLKTNSFELSYIADNRKYNLLNMVLKIKYFFFLQQILHKFLRNNTLNTKHFYFRTILEQKNE